MRPLRLEVEGFATFRNRTVLEFGDLDLVAFVGPTGAGKSTIIDAITFALYGSVARYDNANMVAPVIHQLSTEAKVRFDFEVAGRQYVAVRVVRRRGGKSGRRRTESGTDVGSSTEPSDRASTGATTKEARLERLVEGQPSEVLAGNVRELDAAVMALIGLDFSQFTRTVVLPQGEFAQFLKDEPASRQRLLRSLLDLEIYARMGSAAREAAKVAANQADALTSELGRREPVSDQQLAELDARVETLGELRSAVEAGLSELAEVDERLAPLRQQVTDLDERKSRLLEIAVPDELSDVDTALADLTARRGTLAEAVAARREAWQAARGAMAEQGDRSELTALLGRFDQAEQAEAARAEAHVEIADLRAELATAEREFEQSTSIAVEARARLSTLRRSADASAWRAELIEGEACPVCLQTVTDVPDHPHDDEVAQAEKDLAGAEAAEAAAGRVVSKLGGSIQALEETVERLAATLEAAKPKLDDVDRQTVANRIERLAEAEQEAAQLLDQLGESEQELAAVAERHDRLTAEVGRWTARFAQQRDRVSVLEPPAPSHSSLAADWSALAAWAADQLLELEAGREKLAVTGRELAQQRGDITRRLGGLVEPHGFDAKETDRLLEVVAVARSEAQGRLDAAHTQRTDDARLQSRIDELAADREINSALGRHLSASGFEGWLLNEALDNIVARATTWLRDLSGGSYSLAVANREFVIIDHHNADERRDVKTLSGGETFLTSLSLALALADSIAELAPIDAPRLESMFLDEGFGTLDAATLDVVAGAIEELASTGRMIGIVTHVRDLAERMPSRFEVTKTPTGSTVELVEL